MAWEVGSLPHLMGVEWWRMSAVAGQAAVHTQGPSSQNGPGEPSWLAPFTPVSVRGEVAEI